MAQPDELFVVGGDDEHAGALGGCLVDELVDVRLGADVHTLGGLVKDENLRIHPQPAGQHHLLLVPPGQVGHRELAVPGPYVEALQPPRDVRTLVALPQDAATEVDARADHRDVLAQGRCHERRVRVPFGRNEAHAHGHGPVRAKLRHDGAVDLDLA